VAIMTTIVRARPTWGIRTSPRLRGLARAGAGAVILLAVILSVGTEPFMRGLAAVSPVTAAIAFALGAVTTVAAAWRWRVIARRLGLTLGWGESVSAYYRSQFLNTVLPGGVIGDIHRAVDHGRTVSRVSQASRAVVAERAAGQTVQVALATIVVVAVGMSGYAPAVSTVLLAVAVACIGVIVAAAVSARARSAITRELLTLRSAFGTGGTVVRVLAASSIVILGHVATFVVACLAVGIQASPERLAALALIVMIAGSIPLNIGGWGPREGTAAWAFAGAGLGAAAGIAATTAFAVLAMIAVAPGAAVVAASALRRRHEAREVPQAVSAP
jgi:glycosyltransferase 2 family protein